MNFIREIDEKGIPAYIAKACLFLMMLIVLDFSIGSFLRYLYFKQGAGQLYRTTYSLDSTKAEFLIFGSSTANHHYVPSIFEDRLKMTVYNTGRDANTIFYNYGIFQSILKRYHPKEAILDFNVGEFKIFPDSYDKISSLLPYYKSNPELTPVIELKSPFEKWKLLSKIYPFNSLMFSILIGNTEYNKSRDYINDQSGYVPLDHVWPKKLPARSAIKPYEIDAMKIKILKAFIAECKRVNIELYICISPNFIEYTNKDLSVELVHRIANEYHVPFYNFSQDPLFLQHPEYFADLMHLNKTGAEVFTNKVIDKIIKDEPERFVKHNEYFSAQSPKR